MIIIPIIYRIDKISSTLILPNSILQFPIELISRSFVKNNRVFTRKHTPCVGGWEKSGKIPPSRGRDEDRRWFIASTYHFLWSIDAIRLPPSPSPLFRFRNHRAHVRAKKPPWTSLDRAHLSRLLRDRCRPDWISFVLPLHAFLHFRRANGWFPFWNSEVDRSRPRSSSVLTRGDDSRCQLYFQVRRVYRFFFFFFLISFSFVSYKLRGRRQCEGRGGKRMSWSILWLIMTYTGCFWNRGCDSVFKNESKEK